MVQGGRIRLLFVIQLVSMGAMEMSGPFWPVHLRSLELGETMFTLSGVGVYVAPMLGIMLTAGLWGRIGDRVGHRAMMLRALAGLALTQLALAHAGDAWTILSLRFLQGACAGFIAPAQAYGVALVRPERRARLFARLQIATNLGSLSGALAGGLVLDRAPFAWINLAAAILCGLSMLAVWAFLPAIAPGRAPPAATSAKGQERASGLPDAGLVAPLLVVLGVLLLARLVTQAPFSLFMLDRFALGNGVTGLCYGLLALGFILSADAWARHFEIRNAAGTLGRLALVVAGCALVTLVAGSTRSIAFFALLYGLWGVLLGATTPVLTGLISRATGNAGQGRALGTVQAVTQGASIAGIALGGWFSQGSGLQHLYLLVAGIYAVGFGLILLLRLSPRATRPDPLGVSQ